ncbi:MAG TPA: hypothetical protein VGK49_07045, partial [Ilumatobacteraceae bacterium]
HVSNGVLRIDSKALQNGGDDWIYGNVDRDVLIGGPGHDAADGGYQDDAIFGDNAEIVRTLNDFTSPHFQTLTGTLLYGRSDQAPFPTGNGSGGLLVDGIARRYRDPDDMPWWAEYDVVQLWHDFEANDGVHWAGSFGNDYLAGNLGNDVILGELGHDTIQGDGSVDWVSPGSPTVAFGGIPVVQRVGSFRTPGGPCVAGSTCDPVGPLTTYASIERTTDGEDYIEGNGGNDTVFGGLGQDDIAGGSSSFFSLNQPHLRPDGADQIYGGSGQRIDRNDNGGTTLGAVVPENRHGRDSDAIVGDNGDIVRIVGILGCDFLTAPGGCQGVSPRNYVSFVYDDGYGEQLVVRGVTLLDYTPGGPDYRPDLFGLGASGPCSTSAPETQDGCSQLLPVGPGTNTWVFLGHRETAGNDEVHGELGDDFIYLGGGSDVAYGDADDDEIIGGWGNDWISGGVGQDAILGDDGRIFGSRNSQSGWTAGRSNYLPSNCTGTGYAGTCYSEPLYGITAFRPPNGCPEQHTVLCGDYLNQYISTPGEVQTAVINIAGDLKKTVDLTPFNLAPEASGGDRAEFDANNSDDVIFGGLGGHILPNYPALSLIGHRNNEEPPAGLPRGIAGDFLHGGAGDDAIAGGEAIWNAYTQVYDRTVLNNPMKPNAYRSDFTRPFNPGDLLHFGEDAD